MTDQAVDKGNHFILVKQQSRSVAELSCHCMAVYELRMCAVAVMQAW